jgi:hypothetical protein
MYLSREQAPEWTTLSLWKFRIETPEGRDAVFVENREREFDLMGPVIVEGVSETVLMVLEKHLAPGNMSLLYDIEPSDGPPMSCGDVATDFAILIAGSAEADLTSTILFFAGRPGSPGSALCGTLKLLRDEQYLPEIARQQLEQAPEGASEN